MPRYNPPALLLPTVLVNIIVVIVFFRPRLRIRYPEFILVIIVISKARYKTLHSTSHRKLSERVGIVDQASSYEPKGRGFNPAWYFIFFFTLLSCHCLDIAQKFKMTSRQKVYTLHGALKSTMCRVKLAAPPID